MYATRLQSAIYAPSKAHAFAIWTRSVLVRAYNCISISCVLCCGSCCRPFLPQVRHWGLSNETTFGVCQFCESCKRQCVPLPVSIQNDFSLVYRWFECELAEACAPSNYNIGAHAYMGREFDVLF